MSHAHVTSAHIPFLRRVSRLLTKAQRRAALGLAVLMFGGMVLETLGIGVVIPVLAILGQADLTARHPGIAAWLGRLGNPSREWLVGAVMLGLVLLTLVKAIFVAFVSWRQARFVAGIQITLSQRLFRTYLRMPYAFHLQRNSSQLMHNILSQVGETATVIQQSLILATEVLVLLGIAGLLIWTEPVGAMVVGGILGLAGWGFSRTTNRHVARWAIERQRYDAARIKHLQQGLSGVKEVKLLGREQEFLDHFETNNLKSAGIVELQLALQALPRLWLEVLAVTGLAGLVVVMMGRGRPMESLIPALGLFAAAAFRIMPSVNRVLLGMQSVRFLSPSIENVSNELNFLPPSDNEIDGGPLPLVDSLTLDHVGFQYVTAAGPALRDVCLSIPHGASVGFVGTSGAGKSTLVDVILGLLTPTTGNIRVDGVDIQSRLRGWQDQIGYVPQTVFLTDDSLRRNVAFGLANEAIDEAAVARAIRAAQLGDFVAGLRDGLDTMVGERGVRLSGGQRQRIGIARALYHNPTMLVLDEATSSLDTATERGVMDAVRALRGGKTIIIVAHRLSTVDQCDRLYRLEHGQIVDEGETAAVLRRVHSRTAS
jgi:ABC-type multidrug transport system fused ATPase/permease subunit